METEILTVAARAIRETTPWPLRVLAVQRPNPTASALVVESGDRSWVRKLVLDVAPAHAALYLAFAGRVAEDPVSGFGANLPGSLLMGIEPTEDPRILRFPCDRGRSLVVAWTGRSGNVHLLDGDDVVIDGLLRGGAAAGEAWRAGKAPALPRGHDVDTTELALALSEMATERWPRALHQRIGDLSHARAVDLVARSLEAGTDPLDRAAWILRAIEREVSGAPVLYLIPRRAEIPWGEKRRITAEALGLPAAVLSAGPRPTFEPWRAPEGRDSDPWSPHIRAHAALLAAERDATRRREALRRIDREMARLLKLRKNLIEERGLEGEGRRLRLFGEMILAHFSSIERGQETLVCRDWNAPEGSPPIEVPLDPARSAKEIADDYFKRARRWERGEPHRKKRLELIDQAAAKLSGVRTRARDAENAPAPDTLEVWLNGAIGILYRAPRGAEAPARPRRHAPKTPKKSEPTFRPRAYDTREGWKLWVGRSNRENDHLTHHLAHPEDLWFHAHGVPGSHVVLRREGRKDNPSAKTLEEAAAIAAWFSKARHAGKVPVIYTLKKYVRKPRKAPAGLAMVEREKMILTAPRNPEEGRTPEWEDEGEE